MVVLQQSSAVLPLPVEPIVFELRVLGALDLEQDGSQVLSILSQPKRAALLCYLAMASARGLRRRDELLALFWPEQDTERARAALRQSAYFLRRSLGDVLVARGDEELGVDAGSLWCDAVMFEDHCVAGRWEPALALYRGPLLPSFGLDGCPDLVEWMDSERARLQHLACEAAWRLAEASRAAGEAAAATEWARRALALAPTDEAAVRRCMELHEQLGERAAALQVYEEYARRLARELEIEPSQELAGLAARLRVPAAPRSEPAAAAPSPPSPPSAPPMRSVAVLPFVSMSANPDDQFFSDGLTDEIITTLAKITGLRVASRTSSFAYKGRSMDVREIGRELNVATVLEGSVQRSGERLRIVAQLIECGGGFHVWSARWDSELQDVFAIEDQIAASVGRVLRTLLNHSGEYGYPQQPRTSIDAYEHYLRGRAYFHQMRQKSMGFAREMFRKAIEADPGYALAHAAFADTVALERMYYPAADADMPAAERASRRALKLDPSLAEAHSARANVFFQLQRYEEAEEEFRTAIRMDPQLFEAYYFYARMCFQTGRLEHALDLFLAAARLRDDYQASFFAAQTFTALGRTAEATEQYELALRCAASHMDLNPDDPRAATMCAVALCRLGRSAEGLAWGRRAVEIDPEDAGVRYNVACLHAVAGEHETALRLIDEVVGLGFGNRDWLEQDPDLASIREDPHFREVLASM